MRANRVISKYGLDDGRKGSLLLSCVLRFYPKTWTFDVKFPVLKNLLPESENQKPILIKKPSVNESDKIILVNNNKKVGGEKDWARNITSCKLKRSREEDCQGKDLFLIFQTDIFYKYFSFRFSNIYKVYAEYRYRTGLFFKWQSKL